MRFEANFKDHFSKTFSPEIVQYAKDHVFKNYMFIKGKRTSKGREYTGYCTYCCKNSKITSRLKHNDEGTCPICGEKVTIKSAGLSRTYMIDEAYFVYYEKSLINPKILVARGIHAIKDYRGDHKAVKTHLKDRALYIFEMGSVRMYRRYTWYSVHESLNSLKAGSYSECKSIYSDFGIFWNRARTIVDYARYSIESAIKGTPFQYSTWDKYDYQDMTHFFDLYSKYPCIEYLTKAGLKECVEDKLCGRLTYGAVNWNGKSFLKVLRLSKSDFNAIKSSKCNIDSHFLRLYQLALKDRSNLSLAEFNQIDEAFSCCDFNDVLIVRKYSNLKKSYNYVRKQLDSSKGNKKSYYCSISSVLRDYRDYLSDCVTLGMDIGSESVLFPKSLYKAHQNTIKQIKLKADETLNSKITKRCEVLNRKYNFEFNGLFIRPAASSNELINEGKALSHCVGTYAQRYADGGTNILVIRKTIEPDKPYYTMEISNNNRIIQTRGNHNCAVNDEVALFIEAFREKLSEDKHETRERIMVPA